MTVQGIDISAAQGELTDAHWAALAASGVRFVYIEGQVGNDGPNPRFAEYVAGARAAGLVVGAYSFAFILPANPAHPGRAPEDQAQAFFEACGGLGSEPGDLPHALDLEWPGPSDWAQWGVDEAMADDWAQRCFAKLDALFGRPSIAYTYPDFAAHVVFGPWIAQRKLWLASYTSSPIIPAPWTSLAIQQVSGGGGHLPNGAPVDQDICDDAVFASLLQ